MTPQPKRRPGDPDDAPDRTSMDQHSNVLRSEGLGNAGGLVGGPGQTVSGRLFPFLARRRQEKAKRAAMAAYRLEKQAPPEV